jgi:hypothetical protein
VKVYFSEIFEVEPSVLDEYGAFNVSLLTDLPLFVDPFLLFHSENPEYQELHNEIIEYLRLLKDKAGQASFSKGLARAYYCFPEVKQTWLGFSESGNDGRGLGMKFARALHANLNDLFKDFGQERVTQQSHLEKLCLIEEGVGRDNISDFTLNLIRNYITEYTQTFAKKYLKQDHLKTFAINRARFNYKTGQWEMRRFTLPSFNGDYVLLVPRDLLTRDETWINKSDLISDFEAIPQAIEDDTLRQSVNDYFRGRLVANPKKEDRETAAMDTLRAFPQLIDFYIKLKEEHGDQAIVLSGENVEVSEQLFVRSCGELIEKLKPEGFYDVGDSSKQECMRRIQFFKDVIEKKDGWRIFFVDGKPVRREKDAQIMFKLVWYASLFDVNSEVNNGRGPVDFKVSIGSSDSALVEFKLASNSQLARNIERQVEIYKQASDTPHAITVVIFFTEDQGRKTEKILKANGVLDSADYVLIDARDDNKVSASKA